MLKPHLVIVGVLQGNDLASAGDEPRVGTRTSHGLRSAANRRHSPPKPYGYDQIDSVVRDAFERGNLNPSVVWSAVHHPEYFLKTFDLERDETQKLIKQLSAHLQRIYRVTHSAKAAAIVVSVPFGLYVSRQQFDHRQAGLGFRLDAQMLSSNSPDDAIQLAAQGAGLPFSTITATFRTVDGAPLFFPLDGHFNVAGHELFAQQLAPVVAARLGTLPVSCRG